MNTVVSDQIRSNEREIAAQLVEAMMDQSPWSDKIDARCALAIAARAIRRGRHLTNKERNENLAVEFDKDGDHKTAELIRRLIP